MHARGVSSLPIPAGALNCATSPSSVGCYTVTATSANNWLVVAGVGGTPLTGAATSTSLGFQVSANPAPGGVPLAASTIPYTGTVTITVPSAVNSPVVLNVNFVVSSQPTLNVSPTPAGFGYTVGGTAPASQTINLTAGGGAGVVLTAGFTASIGSCSSTATGGPANPFTLNGGTTSVSGIANGVSSTPFPLVIGANVTGITSAMSGVYSCTLTIVSPGTSGGPGASNASQSFPLSLTVASTPIITITNCTGNGFAYTLSTAAATPATITCTITDTSSTIGINNLTVTGCPGSWETCVPTATSIPAGGTTTLTLTASNLANQNPGTFGPPAAINAPCTTGGICISGNNATGGGTALPGVVPGINIVNTPLITLTPSTGLVFGGPTGYTQGNLVTPGNQVVTGGLAEGSGGTPSGPGTPGTGTLTAAVAASSFLAGACSPAVSGGTPANWLAVTQTSTGTGTAAVYTETIAVNPAVFPTLSAITTCTGTINVNSTGVTPAAAQKTIPVSFTLNPAPGFTVTPLPVPPFTIVSGYPVSMTSTAAPVAMTVSSAPTQGQSYTVTITPVTGGNWLTTTAATGTTSATTPGFSLGVAAAASATLSPASSPYFATVTVAPSNSSQPVNTPPVTFTVQLNVDAAATLTATGTPALSGGAFNLGTHFIDFTAPGSQVLNVATMSATAGAPITPTTFTVTQNSLAGSTPANLLVINGTQPYTTTGTATTVPVTLTYSAAVANSLAPGTYGGVVAVTVNGAGVTTVPQTISIPWSITIDAEPAIQTTPTSQQGVIMNVVLGGTGTATVAVAASSTGLPVNIPVSVSVTSLPTPWLSITSAPSTANGASISLSASTVGLQANTSYAGQIVVTSASAANSPYTVPVTLNVLTSICTFSLSGNTSLTSIGTATPSSNPAGSGVLPEVPVSLTITPLVGTSCTNTYTATSSAPWLVVTGGTTVSFTAVSNAHSTQQTATITVTSVTTPPSVQTITVTEAGSTAALTSRQITALYQTMLGRDPDSSGWTYWNGVGVAGLGQMADCLPDQSGSLQQRLRCDGGLPGCDGRSAAVR